MWQQARRIMAVALLLMVTAQALPQTLIQHPWQGKRVAYFGDSITDPRNSGSKKKYWGYLQDWLQITPYVYGVSGRQWNDIPRQTDKLLQEHGQDVDAILIFCGTNDYNNGVPIGEWYEEKDEQVMYGHGSPKKLVDRKRRYPAMDKGTYRGRINIALDKVKRMYPTKQIILLTPIHRAGFYANDKNWQCTEDYTNQCGIYLDEYIQAVKDAGNIWAVPVIDLNAVSGLYPMMDEHAQYFKSAEKDRLHPNDKGHERLARTLYYQLNTIPCAF
jgi:lysophospholipase L1-like esterase